MKKILYSGLIAGLAWIGISACDPSPPPDPTIPRTYEPKAIPAGETLTDVVRETLAEIVRDEDAYSRARRLGAFLPTLGPETVLAAVQTLEDLSVDMRASELEMLVRYWAAHQPEEAAEWAKEKSPLNYRSAAVYSALRVWAEADPQAAVTVAWIWMEETALERIVPIALVRGWYAADNPPALTHWFRDLPIGIFRQRAIAAYIRVVIQKQGFEAVERWAVSLPTGENNEYATFKLAVNRRVIDALSLIDTDAALRWCDTHCDGPYGDNTRSLIARNWLLRGDGPAALAWLSRAPEGADRDLAVQLTFSLWARMDREAALAWITAQTIGGPVFWLQPTYPEYAKLLTANAPAEGIKWAELIENEQQREILLILIARAWRHLDESAAEEWLLQSPLSEEAREQVRPSDQ